MNNYLDDITAEIGAGYNTNEKGAFFNASLSYAKFFPALTLSADRKYRTANYLMPDYTLANLKYVETVLGGAVAVPLRWIKGNYATSLQPNLDYAYHITQDAIVSQSNVCS